MSELTPEQVTEIRSLRARRYTNKQVCLLMNCTEKQIFDAMKSRFYGSKEPGEEQIIDGEPIAERIERMKRELWFEYLDELKTKQGVQRR